MWVLILAAGARSAATINGGEPDGEGYSNVGVMTADIDGEPQWRCSGTPIAPRVFLTADHCVGGGADAARVWLEIDLINNEEYAYGGEWSNESTPVPYRLYLWGGDED